MQDRGPSGRSLGYKRSRRHSPVVTARDQASAFGIDLALLDANLRLTPDERLAELDALSRLSEEMQAQTLTAEQRTRLEWRAMLEELQAYGFGADLRLWDALGP